MNSPVSSKDGGKNVGHGTDSSNGETSASMSPSRNPTRAFHYANGPNLVTPSPVGRSRGEDRVASASPSSACTEEEGAEDGTTERDLLIAVGVPDEKDAKGDDDKKIAAKQVLASLKPVPKSSSPDDEKTRARQARLAALAQQQLPSDRPGTAIAVAPRAAAGPDDSGCPGVLAPPVRTEVKKEDPEVVAKRQGRISFTSANVRKLAPPTSVLTRRSTTVSSVSTTSSHSTTVTQNTAPCAATLQAVSLVLDDDDDDDDNGVIAVDIQADLDSKERARPSLIATGQQRSSPAARRNTTNLADADAAVKRSTRMTSGELAQRSRRRRATHLGCASHAAAANGLTMSGSQHSTASSSVGAHSVSGGSQASKKSSDDDDEEEDAVRQHLASIASGQQHRRTGPGLVLPDSEYEAGKMIGNSTHSSARMTMDHAILEEDEDLEFAEDGMDDVEIEAQAGIPVVQPGAFAVEGLNENNNANEDDLREVAEIECQGSGVLSQNSYDPTLTDPNSALFFDEEAALEARLYDENLPQFLEAELHREAELVDACVLTEDPEGLSPKARRRMRFMQCTVFCLALGAIAAVVGLAISRPNSSKSNPWTVDIPTIKGWTQVGNNLTGPTDDDKSLYGYSVSISGEAERIAVGVPGRDQSATELLVGETYILDWNGSQWSPNGLPLIGPGPNAKAGTAVALSKYGNRIAVASPFYTHGGQVSVYEETEPQKWERVGQVLMGAPKSVDADFRFGGALALSEDGTVLAVGSSMGKSANFTNSGFVRVFQLQSAARQEQTTNLTVDSNQDFALSHKWVQLGDDITGENAEDFFGWSLAMNLDGTRIAAGAVGSTGNGVGELAGQVRVFDFEASSALWRQAGPSIPGLIEFDSFGSSVALSDMGDTLAVGAIGHSTAKEGVDVGNVRIFQYSEVEKAAWEPLGQILLGENAFDSFGFSVSLSSDGKTVAAGGPRNNDFAESSGQIQVFSLDNSTYTWVRIGSSIGGSYEGRGLFGWSCALSSDGRRVAGGAPFSTYDGMLSDVGTVRVFDVAEGSD